MDRYAKIAERLVRKASMQRYCFIYKAKDGSWYMDLAETEHGEERDAYTYGPFPSEEAVIDYLHDNHSNPGGWTTDKRGNRSVPRRSPNRAPVEKPRRGRWGSSRMAFKGKREAFGLIESAGGFRGALYALAEVAGIDWRDMPWARKISKILMGTADTVGRIEHAQQSLAASRKAGDDDIRQSKRRGKYEQKDDR